MKVSILNRAPETLYTLTYSHEATDLLLACLPDGSIVRSTFLPVGKAAQAEVISSRIADWQKRFPETRLMPAPREFKADPSRGHLAGTDFQLKVWQELAKLQPGSITNYSALAEATGNPSAVRATGTAVGANPLAPFIPCHRVLTKSGGLGGFAGGLPLKIKLLDAEGITVQKSLAV